MTDGAAQLVLRRAVAHVLVDDVDTPVLDDSTAHHLFRVLRVRDGDMITVTDGCGRWRPCRTVGTAVEIDGATGVIPRREQIRTVAFAIPKADRPEWIVQKLTELGIDRIVPLHADRSVVRWDAERAERHIAKLHRVAVEALEQSRGVWMPAIAGPVASREFLPTAAVAEPGGRAFGGVDTVAIGPEGGWSDEELALAADRVSLGQSVLRVETAALVAGTLLAVSRE